MARYTYTEIAASYELWVEYVDTDAAMTKQEFDSLTIDQKVSLQIDAFGPEGG